ncbi:multiple sugar transport system permease protein [Streptoalloteichus tenebrarius]|uniref:Multiple sugar transport system permease protein n=1 Tax=Streptoalloteichus tenebrarius (strain ATCC 17920 / DSM 40477 / JCM 4838 / CBS 697.72 / NBRC 16177 / NCIMB 11028 / NRRL B-12390 / A12253. 1 / ISP 5477) TaxID=1933 RepID=A0ABT1I335_STRSD|nr:multiple sugar transport system permease protein [Streptoalloteichus tenebrarius]
MGAVAEVTRGGERARPAPPERRRRSVGGVVAVVALAVCAVVFTYPLLWMALASLKPRSEVFEGSLWPSTFVWRNYVTVFQEIPLLTWLLNTFAVAAAAAVAVTISSALVAFAFAFLRFPGRDLLFGLVLATMMLPAAVTLIPTYAIWDALGLTGTQIPLWAGNLFGSAFYIFLLRQFFLTLPPDLLDAGRVDGLGHLGLFRHVVLPLSRPALVISVVFELKASWTDLLKPLVYLQEPHLFTLPRGLKVVLDRFGQGGEMRWDLVLAANVLATLPMVALFFAAQRYFVRGIATTGGR